MDNTFDIVYVFDFIPKLLAYVQITLLIVAGSVGFGLIAGFLWALPRMYNVPVLKHLAALCVSFFRGTPVLILLFLIYYGVPEVLKLVSIDVTRVPVLAFVILTYALNSGAYICEIIRGAVAAVDRGQMEAAYSVGMTKVQAFRRIMLPQALAVSVPNFANKVLANLKETSLAYTLGTMDISGKAQTLGSTTMHFFETYIALSLIYFVIAMILEQLFLLAERRLHRHENHYRARTSFKLFRSIRQTGKEGEGLFNSTRSLS
ncbi:amino acid ABC transporter permease [Paenibacillus sp. J22TS3]|uniref:amino acid ABC transporter permease n=1 Tax=Paenibacillus sp. J22TS3 TaxID=2807192 RepID=UPI001B2D97B3|nr:amino acid ABC transporter permease [Paenibacillus sp. J22TS3]GIP24203.1 L-cystine transport system permease protein TcyL [Paenibacillus sp. J22TS3]